MDNKTHEIFVCMVESNLFVGLTAVKTVRDEHYEGATPSHEKH